ncbi:MAG: tyrosine-type recombinase/integrase [Saprospiraceae bacterium]|nr:tyrosine-type recombinase/integrase [Saprospiraceae bacterium]
MLHLFPLMHKEKSLIGIVFVYDAKITAALKNLSSVQYTKTHSCYYIPYEKAQYNALQSLGIPITSYRSRPDLYQLPIKDGVTSVKTSEYTETNKQAGYVPSNNPVVICFNGNRLWIKMKYHKADIELVRSLSGAYWNKYQIQWSVVASVENLSKIQAHFNYWKSQDYTKIYELIMLTTDPKIVELYSTPEHKDKICLKLKGYGIDTDFVQRIENVRYESEFRRWLLPVNQITVAAILEHYPKQGAKVINRLYQKNVQYKKNDFSNEEKQHHLLKKYPEQYHCLLKAYTDTMIRRNNTWSTINTYTPEMVKFAEAIGLQDIAKADESTINQYLSQLSGKKIAVSTIHTAINAIKYYYQKVIFRQDLKIDQLARPKKGFHLPTILSAQETNGILQSLANIKHVCILYVLYGCGVRLNELLSIQMNDLWWERNQIIIRNGKGDKDRVVMLSQTLKQLLRIYCDEYMPQQWLLEGQDRLSQYSERSVQKVVKSAIIKAGITKKVTPHTLRHCFATHLMDNGVQLPYIQALLGHKDIKTTMIYTHVTTQSIANVVSPLDGLNLTVKKP